MDGMNPLPANHPASEIFPMMGESELADLAKDIRENGLLEPVVLFENLVIDGRNRMAACRLAGVQPQFITENIASPTQYVVSKNLHRRHLTLGQRAAIGVAMLPLLQAEAKARQEESRVKPGEYPGHKVVVSLPPPSSKHGKSTDIAAEAVQVGSSSIGRARVVKDADPEAFRRIEHGESTVNAEYRKLRNTQIPKPLASPKRPSVATEKRAAIIENHAKRRMIEGLSEIRGICRGLAEINIPALLRACTENERKAWAKDARLSSLRLRKFALSLELE